MALRLGPGGKALMILAGLGLIGLGLWYAGLIPVGPSGDDSVVVEPEREAQVEASPDPEPAAEAPPPSDEPTRGPEPSGPPPQSPATGSPPALRPPPLFAESESRLRSSKMVDPGGAAELLRDLAGGVTDIIEIELLDAIEFAVLARPAVVIGARPPARRLLLCAEDDPIESLRSGAEVGVGRSTHRLAAAHVAEAKGVEPASLSWVGVGSTSGSTASRVLILDREREDLFCLSLFEIGAQGPTLLLARRHDASVYSKSYIAAAASLGGAGEFGSRYLSASSDDPSGYEWHSLYAAQLLSRMRGSPSAAPPEVAGWIVGGHGR